MLFGAILTFCSTTFVLGQSCPSSQRICGLARLAGKTAIVTGGASGIGESSVCLFADHGANVVIADLDAAKGQALARSLGKAGLFVQTDVSSSEQVQRLVAKTVEAFGRVDIMFNNAGVVLDGQPIIDFSEDAFDRTIAINLKGVFLGMKYAIREMISSGGGSVINTASIAGVLGYAGQCAYGASKGGVLQLSRHVATEVAAYGIRVNCICPGGVLTPLVFARRPGVAESEIAEQFANANPMRRAGLPIDIAHAALWLASDESTFVTGQTVTVDGGRTTSVYRGPSPDLLSSADPAADGRSADHLAPGKKDLR